MTYSTREGDDGELGRRELQRLRRGARSARQRRFRDLVALVAQGQQPDGLHRGSEDGRERRAPGLERRGARGLQPSVRVRCRTGKSAARQSFGLDRLDGGGTPLTVFPGPPTTRLALALHTIDGVEEEYVEFWPPGTAAEGRFCCTACGNSVSVRLVLPRCMLCGERLWERAERSPFARSAWDTGASRAGGLLARAAR